MTAHNGTIHLAKWRFEYVKVPLILSLFVLALALIKIGYHHAPWLSDFIPESCALILLGLALGGIFSSMPDEKLHQFLVFNDKSFFLLLLPPIILEAAYSLRDRAFFDNIGTILLYAVLGTVLNTALVAPSLYGASMLFGVDVEPIQCFIFAALISAVDPVAVLAIFQEVGVNKMLYFMVFGESLLNDAVSVVLYNLSLNLLEIKTFGSKEVLLGFLSFICVAFGGSLIGLLWGFLSSLVTKYTGEERIVEPIVLYSCAYLAYLCAEMVHFSGIIAIICCGIFQATYAFDNLAPKSYVTVQFSSKVFANIMESIIFIILGVMLLNDTKYWQFFSLSFSLSALVICLLVRYLIVFFLTYFVNWYTKGIRRISLHEQLIMGYGGLRGAIAFSLTFMLDDDAVPVREMFLGATYMIILFTVFFQGITMKPLVRFLQIRLAAQSVGQKYRLFLEFHRVIQENFMAGVEEVIGSTYGWKGANAFSIWCKTMSRRFIRPLVNKKQALGRGKSLAALNEELTLEDEEIKRSHSYVFNNQSYMDSTMDHVHKAFYWVWNCLQMSLMSNLPASHSSTVLEKMEPEKRKPSAPCDDHVQEKPRTDSKKPKRPVTFELPQVEDGKHGPEEPLTPRRRNKLVDKLNLDNARDMAHLRGLINNPPHKKMHYQAADRTMSSAWDEFHNKHSNRHARERQRHAWKHMKEQVMAKMHAMHAPHLHLQPHAEHDNQHDAKENGSSSHHSKNNGNDTSSGLHKVGSNLAQKLGIHRTGSNLSTASKNRQRSNSQLGVLVQQALPVVDVAINKRVTEDEPSPLCSPTTPTASASASPGPTKVDGTSDAEKRWSLGKKDSAEDKEQMQVLVESTYDN